MAGALELGGEMGTFEELVAGAVKDNERLRYPRVGGCGDGTVEVKRSY